MFDEQCLFALLALLGLFTPLDLDSSDSAFAAPSDDIALRRHCQ